MDSLIGSVQYVIWPMAYVHVHSLSENSEHTCTSLIKMTYLRYLDKSKKESYYIRNDDNNNRYK